MSGSHADTSGLRQVPEEEIGFSHRGIRVQVEGSASCTSAAEAGTLFDSLTAGLKACSTL